MLGVESTTSSTQVHSPSSVSAASLSQFFSSSAQSSIPNLPILNQMVKIANEQQLVDFSKTVVVGVQHILDTTASLFQSLIQLGVKKDRMYFMGKCYSTSDAVARVIRDDLEINLFDGKFPKYPGGYDTANSKGISEMWATVVEDLRTKHKDVDTIIILDEGGHCLEAVPNGLKFKYQIAGLEQTRNGLYRKVLDLLPFPVVSVATCAAKRVLESPLIAEVVTKHIEKLIQSFDSEEGKVFGVIGNGTIGDAIVSRLLDLGKTVVVYDHDQNAFAKSFSRSDKTSCYRLESVAAVIANADYIIGCTGIDVTEKVEHILSIIKHDKIFISCSSEDTEFNALLCLLKQRQFKQDHPLSEITCELDSGAKVSVLRGGFPVNFDRSSQSVLPEKIQLTRGLILGACLQAGLTAKRLVFDGVTINKDFLFCSSAKSKFLFVLYKTLKKLGVFVKFAEASIYGKMRFSFIPLHANT